MQGSRGGCVSASTNRIDHVQGSRPIELALRRAQEVAASVRMSLPVGGQSRTLRILLMHPEQSLARRLASAQPEVSTAIRRLHHYGSIGHTLTCWQLAVQPQLHVTAQSCCVYVDVASGVLELAAFIFDERELQAMSILAEVL